jgi:hypothetical protein
MQDNTITKPSRAEKKWDKHNSTYFRVIRLQNGIELTGYSKKIGMEERRDKIELLINWIIRDFEAGYLDKNTTDPRITPTNYLEYYRIVNYSAKEYEHVFTLDYYAPQWSSSKFMADKRLTSFMVRFYSMMRSNSTPTAIRSALYITTRAEKLDPLDYSKPRFLSREDVQFFAVKLRAEGKYTIEQIDHFMREYINKYFPNGSRTIQIRPN